ncbi:hypothetical protein ACFV0A_27385, partial [Streptomyces sp. NPDC059552]
APPHGPPPPPQPSPRPPRAGAPPARAAAPRPGDRAPDCGGLEAAVSTYPMRLYDVLREREHVLLLYEAGAGGGAGAGIATGAGTGLDRLVRTARDSSGGRLEVCVLLAPDADAQADAGAGIEADAGLLPVYIDSRGEFARLYAAEAPTAFVIRPDGYLGARLSPPDPRALAAHLAAVFAPGAP